MASPESTPIVFVTIDTEEDAWGAYDVLRPEVTNIRRLPAFQDLCDRFGVRPTYLVNWPVVDGAESGAILRELVETRDCAIGTHIHAWNTPPFSEGLDARESMLCNVPSPLAEAKIQSVHDLISDRLGIRPICFRSGRWGFGPRIARALVEMEYHVDSSVSPYMDWSSEDGPDYREASDTPYRFYPEAPLEPNPAGPLLQIPATVGFVRGNPERRRRFRDWALEQDLFGLGLIGIYDRLGIARLRWLSPELASARNMVRLAQTLVDRGVPALNFTFHSPTLVPGLTPFVQDDDDLSQFTSRIERFFEFAAESGFRFETLDRGPEVLGLDQDTP